MSIFSKLEAHPPSLPKRHFSNFWLWTMERIGMII